jgi:serine/threonine protein kinase/beta-lactam-binding protein with PASTA domain
VGEFRPGEIVGGRYEIIELLGSGGMANVYRAHDPHLGRDVAVKVLAARFAADPAFVERFRREASAAAQLNHPNIVQVFDRGETDGTYFIVMEYLVGPDLKSVIRTRGALPPLEAIDDTQQILAALAAAHRRDVIHRDIKPQNVMLASDGLLKVTDFGIARAGTGSDMTEAGSVIGTAQYLSPEQAHGGELTSASDCYSAGIVLYELLTGRVPFDGDRPVVVAMKQINEPPVPPRTYEPDIPPALESVVLTALAKRPSERYRSAEEFSAALADVRRQIDPSTTGQHTTMMAAAASDAAGQTSVMSSQPPPQPTAVTPTATARPTPKKRSRTTAIVIGIIVLLGIAAIGGVLLLANRGGSSGSVTVPSDIAGQTESAAKAELIALGFKVTTKTVTSSSADKGNAIGTIPPGGQSAPKGSTVVLNIGGGPKTSAVPNVVGLSQAAATSALQSAGFSVVVVQTSSTSVQTGDVVSQNPAAATQLAPQSSVTITVSSGAQVPNVVGKSLSTATQDLRNAGLSVGTVSYRSSSNIASGDVISQSVPAGSTAQAGATVNLVVSNGPATSTVPSVIGLTATAASSDLSSAGFSPVAQNAYSSSVSAGIVFAQSPSAGSTIAKGSTVRYTVSLGPPPSTGTTPTGTSTTTTPAPPP